MAKTSIRKRDANGLLRSSLRDWRDGEKIPFFCECADESCYQAVWLAGAEYDQARENSTWVALSRSHDGAAR